jgi:peptide/nickel transport system permease protein
VNEHRNEFLLFALAGLLKSKKGMLGATLLSLSVAIAILAPLISPYDPTEMHSHDLLLPPEQKYIFGTDQFGRDVFSRTVWGSRISLFIGFASIIIALSMGLVAGLIAGYYGGKIDEFFMRMVDVLLSLPVVFLALVIMAAVGVGLGNLILAIAVVYTPQFIRMVRSVVLSIREKEFVEAAVSAGSSNREVMFREILPNLLAPLIVQASICFAYAVLTEASLSFLGLGVQPPTPAWGYMLDEGMGYLERAPWINVFPGVAILLTVLGFNLFGDGLRDALDPRLRLD